MRRSFLRQARAMAYHALGQIVREAETRRRPVPPLPQITPADEPRQRSPTQQQEGQQSPLRDRSEECERHAELAEEAADRLYLMGYRNVIVRVGDGTLGWPEAAPFDAIVVAAGSPEVPAPLIEQLAPGGRLIVPVGPRSDQRLFRYVRDFDGRVSHDDLGPVAFVPLIGAHGWSRGE